MKNQFLATGDNSYLLTTTAAEAAPCIRFNKEGIQFAVSTSENGIKILANADCVRLLRSIENQAVDTSRVAPATIAKGPIISTFSASCSTAGTST
ncbi:topless-related protein 4-like isoform X2 [Castanea sativa]|uniref:topless-related protein 4-like isoform X2 n=1 Tax=Castanea sativa TaxID=21020 RepID=UPI003AEE6D7A